MEQVPLGIYSKKKNEEN
ncbi:hypothetical protein CAEBREN_11429 [Caenorhabditis brenneri]|uniref:Uncharacterized protein n=1 Tax=Caenorhabditis brenneri TaxID=135651 RepID=G0N0P1_CAEBE|nr:hypothetical protein CAEBREN_11429 [Caenorhabditis brenneri]